LGKGETLISIVLAFLKNDAGVVVVVCMICDAMLLQPSTTNSTSHFSDAFSLDVWIPGFGCDCNIILFRWMERALLPRLFTLPTSIKHGLSCRDRRYWQKRWITILNGSMSTIEWK
jgi:hypothetical protein